MMIAAAHLRLGASGQVSVRIDGRSFYVVNTTQWMGYGDVTPGVALHLRTPGGATLAPEEFPQRRARDLNWQFGWRYFANEELIEVVSE